MAADAFKGKSEFWKRKIRLQVYEQRTLTKVDVSLDLNFDSFTKLSAQVPLYLK
jgi:hypothetical protein